MKIIPYLRFAWAAQILIQTLSYKSSATVLGEEGIFWDFFRGLLVVTFIIYCVIMGIQEIKGQQLIEASYFYIFGIFFESIVFLGGLYILNTLLGIEIEIWRISMVIFWQIVLLVILLVDVKRMWVR